MTDIKNPFKSFWMGGYECTDQLNTHGDRVDFLKITSHLNFIREDYKMLETISISTVRQGNRWSAVEYNPYHYDFSTVRKMMDAAREGGIQQIWDICHFGYPDDLSPLHPHFTRRFVALCKAFASFYFSVNPDDTLIVTPINEVSFISWLGGDVASTSPYCRNNGWELKYALMRAYIEGVKALREINPGIRILTTEPLVNMVPPLNATPEQIQDAKHRHELQYQSVDMLCGRICPELGGKMEYLDILGFNFYYNNEWITGTYDFLGWNDPVPDTRWRPLSDLLKEAHLRYDRPVALTETSHPGEDRPLWINMIGREVAKLLEQSVPFWGICLYPIVDRPDWDNLDDWHHSGIWDTQPLAVLSNRILHEPSAQALKLVQQKLGNPGKIYENQNSYLPGDLRYKFRLFDRIWSSAKQTTA